VQEQPGSTVASVADEAYTADFDDDDAGRLGPSGRTQGIASISESGVYTEDWQESSEAARSGSGPPSEVQSEAKEDMRGGGGGESASVVEEVDSASAFASAIQQSDGGARAGGYSDTFENDSVAEEVSGIGSGSVHARFAQDQVHPHPKQFKPCS
jgi:hypothetical protein